MTTEFEITGRAKTYQNIKAELCGRLAQKKPSSGRLPPIRQLAKDLGVGQSSLHQAIKELVNQGLLISRPKLGTFINAAPQDFLVEQEKTISTIANSPADHPLSQKWVQLLYYRSAMAERFYLEAAEAFTAAIGSLGMQATKDYLEQNQPNQLLTRNQPDALVIINPTQTLKLACAPAQALVAISTTQQCNLCQQDRFDLVAIDDLQGGIVAGDCLKKCGWTDVCFIGVQEVNVHKQYNKTSQERLTGLTRGLGHPVQPERQIFCLNYDVAYGAMAVSEWLKMSPRPQAVFAVSDDIAFGFINGALSHGLQPGRDYQIIGLDGQQMGKELGVGTLTTVAAPIAEMGKMAAKLLIDRLNNPHIRSRRVLLGCDLIKGDTVTTRVPEH